MWKWDMQTATSVVAALQRGEMRDQNLSPNFTIGEMIASATAKSRGLKNIPKPGQLLSMVTLCERVLEPVLAEFGPVRITSGFRIFTPDSQHGKGEAADFEVTGVANLAVAKWIRDTLQFDQLILEAWSKGDPNAGWIHCSYREGRLRKSVLRTPTGGAPYTVGLPA